MAYLPFMALIIFLLLGIPIAFSIAVAGILGIWLTTGNLNTLIGILGMVPYNTVAQYALTTVPMFILMAFLSSSSGLAKDLYNASSNWLSHIRGGLAIGTVFACGIFGAMSGASVAAASVMSEIAMPNMRRYGYSDVLATGVIGVGATLYNKERLKMIIPDHVEKNAKLYRDNTAILFENRRCTFDELEERVYRLSNGLLGLGVVKGDRVAVIQDNCFEYPELYYGIGKTGAIITPLNYRLTGSELTYLLNHSEANTLIIGRDFIETIKPFLSELNFIKNYICLEGKTEGMIDYDELLSCSSTQNPGQKVQSDDVASLIYTGGTTGRPKGVILTHKNWMANATTNIVEWKLQSGEIDLIVTPLFHVGSSWPLFANFIMGNTEIILKRVDIENLLRIVERERVTTTLWISPVVRQVINYQDLAKFDLSSLKLVITGGAPSSENQLRKLIEVTKCRLMTGSGQTETGWTTKICVNEHLNNPERVLSVGTNAYNMEIRVVDDLDQDVVAGEVGELITRGDGVMQGYWKMPGETAQTMRGGWHHTGDLVRIDGEGYITYVDRKKDMIKTGGENVFSQEVEEVLSKHKAVLEAAVIGIPDEKWGEAIKALIVLREGEKATEEELIAHCKKHIAGFKCPKSVEFCESFPRTGLGKIAKNILRDEYWKGYERKVH